MQPTVTASAVRTLAWLQTTAGLDVPVYQRDYRWGLDACRRLLHDVRNAKDHSHFIGSIITTGRMLVDGQQRITTIFLLLIALREREDHPEIERILRTPRGRPRLRTHPEFEPVMAALINNRTPEDVPPHAAPFIENLNEFRRLLDLDLTGVWEGLNHLENIVVSLGDAADPQQVFESLNSTGEALKDNELIHNYVLMGLTRPEQEIAEREIWVPIEQQVGRGMERFWRDVLVMAAPALTDLRGNNGHYRHFRTRYPGLDTAELQRVGPRWVHLAGIYAVMRDPSGHPHEQALLALRDSFPASAPLVMGLLDARSENRLTEAQLTEHLDALQTLLIRRAVVGRDHELALTSSLTRLLDDLPQLASEMLRRTPEDAAVAVALRHQPVPNPLYVLGRLQQPRTDVLLETVLPASPDDDWDAGDGRPWASLTRDERVAYRLRAKTLGNLTLLERDLATDIGTRPFGAKRAFYSRSSVAHALAAVPVWSVAALDARTSTLVDAFLRAWPRASEGVESVSDARVRLVDLPPLEPDTDLALEYATYGDETLGDARDVRSLFDAVMTPLWAAHATRIRQISDARGWALIADRPEQRRQYRQLDDHSWLYLGWAPDAQLGALQTIVGGVGAEDAVRVVRAG